MHITPWSIYDRPFRSIPSKKTQPLQSRSPRIAVLNSKDEKTMQLKQQSFYTFSPTAGVEREMDRLLVLKVIHALLAEPQMKCFSLPKIQNSPEMIKHMPHLVRNRKNKIKVMKSRQEEQQKMDNKYNESASMLTVPFTDYGLFNDERIVQMKHQQSERDHSKIKLDNILLYDLIKY